MDTLLRLWNLSYRNQMALARDSSSEQTVLDRSNACFTASQKLALQAQTICAAVVPFREERLLKRA